MRAQHQQCESCDHPTTDLLCRFCTRRLVDDLYALAIDTRTGQRRPGLIGDLQDTRFKLDNVATTNQGTSTPGVRPLPFNFAASELLDKARAVLSAVARDFVDNHPHLREQRPPGIAATAEWLAGYGSRLAVQVGAGDMLNAIDHLVREIRRMIDRAPERIYLGVCGALLPPGEDGSIGRCPAELYGAPERRSVRCAGCRREHDAHERWLDIQARVRESLATAAEIAGAMASLYGRQLNVKTIRTWAQRGTIVTYGHDAAGVALHHVGEVLSVAASRPQRAPRTLAKVA